MKYLDLRVRTPAELRHPMEEFVAESDAVEREELVTWNDVAQGDHEYLLFHVEGEIDRYRGAIDGVDSVADYQLTPIDDDRFYAYVEQETRPADMEWRDAFTARNLVVVPPIVYRGDGSFTMTVVGAGDDLNAMLDDFQDVLDVTVERIGDYDRSHGSLTADLTDRQLEAVQAAVELGYYAEPRKSELADVADALDCATSTAATHLQKAEARVMQALIEG
jgi:predicted DNA binding protein